MKIRKGTSTEQYLQELRRRQEQNATDNIFGGLKRKKTGDAEQVDISHLSRHINDSFNVEQIVADRKAKIEDLKQRIANGEYNPSSEDIAQAIASEIPFAIAETRVEDS